MWLLIIRLRLTHHTNAAQSERSNTTCVLQFVYIAKIGATSLQSQKAGFWSPLERTVAGREMGLRGAGHVPGATPTGVLFVMLHPPVHL